MKKFNAFLLVSLFIVCSSAQAQEQEINMPTISTEYPKINKKIYLDYKFKCQAFPDPSAYFGKIDVNQWVSRLERLYEGEVSDCTTFVWDDFGIIRYVWTVKKDQSSVFYYFEENKVEKVAVFPQTNNLYVTEEGVYKWQYLYVDNRVDRVNYIIYPKDNRVNDRSAMYYQIDKVEYWGETAIPFKIVSYKSVRDLQNNRWVYVQDFNARGEKIEKTMKREIKNEY